MPLKQDELNRQLSRANEAIAEWCGILKERGVADDQRHRDPVWRSLNAKRRNLSNRMKTSAEVVAINEELIKRKVERSQIVSTPEETKPKPKKKPKQKKKPSDEFSKLNKRFQQLVRWVEGEENKSYAGQNEVKLGNYYNAKILEGRTVAQKMKKIKNVFKNKDYFDGFLL